MAGKPWTAKELGQLLQAYKKKPFKQELEAFAYVYSKESGRSAHSIRSKIGEMKDAEKIKPGMPRVLIFDIETLPLEVYSWGVYQQFIGSENVIKDWSLSCWSAKWLNEPEVFGAVATPQEAVEAWHLNQTKYF